MNHFNQSASQWDTPEKIARSQQFADAIRTLGKKSEFKKILEIGCGTGLLGSHFISANNAYVGVDTSEKMLEVLKEKFPEQRNVQTHLLNLETEGLSDSGFDLVLSSMAFHHLQRPEKVVERVKQATLPGCLWAIIDLDQEDGSFHPDPKAMGVYHFGFNEAQVKEWAATAGLTYLGRSIVHTPKKNGKEYPVFLALFQTAK